jgi:hypothetical protein
MQEGAMDGSGVVDGSGAAERFWTVEAVHGCERHSALNCAYTIGLGSRGLHELHMWARPTHGDDPGADFGLSCSDLRQVLDEYAQQWVTGSLRVGDVRELSLDDGLTTAIVTVGEPVDASQLEARRALSTFVVPLRWSLHRPPRGAAVEIMADDRASYEADVREAATRCDPRVRVPGASLPDGPVAYDVDGRYGPLSALVEAHALAMAGSRSIETLVANALAAEAAMSPRALIGLMDTMSRLSGRDEQVAEVGRLAARVMDRLEQRRLWRDHVARWARESDDTVARMSANLRDLAETSFRCALMSIALDDVLPPDMVLAAQGPWRATSSPSGNDPGQRWRCSQTAERVLRQFFATLDAHGLLDLAAVMVGPVEALLEDDLLVVQGRALTRAAAPPPVLDLVRTPFRLTASMTPVQRQLAVFGQLMTVLIDGQFVLDDERLAQLRWALGGHDDPTWAVP